MDSESVLTPGSENVQPGDGSNLLKTHIHDRARPLTATVNDLVDACERVVAGRTIVERLKYDEDVVENSLREFKEDSLREFKDLEETMPPAAQPARDPLAGVYLLPGEHSDIRCDVRDLLANADEWLATPNSNFGGRSPSDLIGTPDEPLLRESLRSVIYSGMA